VIGNTVKVMRIATGEEVEILDSDTTARTRLRRAAHKFQTEALPKVGQNGQYSYILSAAPDQERNPPAGLTVRSETGERCVRGTMALQLSISTRRPRAARPPTRKPCCP
jgi:hypothetical protein